MRRSAEATFRRAAALLGMISATLAASGQALPVVSPPLPLTPAGEEWIECSVGVSQTNKNDVLVMANRQVNGQRTNLGYASVMWGVAAPTTGVTGLGKADAYLAPHPVDGTIWFAAVNTDNTSLPRIVAGWKEPGASDVPASQIALIGNYLSEDKPGMAIGTLPSPLFGRRYYVVRVNNSNPCSGNVREKVVFTDNPGADWFTTPQEPIESFDGACDYRGFAAAPVVLDTGRIVVAVRDFFEDGQWLFNGGKPYVVYSDDGGYDWKSDDISSPIRIAPGGLAHATDWENDCGNVCPSTSCYPSDPSGAACSTCGETPMQIDRRMCAPAIAADRTQDPNHVYVAFYARSAAESTNTDIIIHRSVDGGETFDPSTQDNPDFLHLTDALLGLTAGAHGPDQLVPAIAVDACGGVNVMFYDNRHDPDPDDCEIWYDVYFARITNFGPTPTVAQWRLTPQSFRVDNLDIAGKQFFGEYQHMTLSADGTTLYLASIARNMGDPEDGVRTCSLHRVNLNCLGAGPADFTGDGEVNGADMEGYLAAFAGGEAAADVDLDWAVGLDDFITYAEWYVERE